jgi:16S rRNA (adenine1518-N6/adenine1519-N6)-dimethyltransferase
VRCEPQRAGKREAGVPAPPRLRPAHATDTPGRPVAPPATERPAPGEAPPPTPAAPGRGPTNPAALLRRLGLHPRKGLSQSFLVDRRVCAAIVRAAELDPHDEVLEIGPGLGILTAELVRRAGRVVAVELDPQLAAALPALLGHPANLQVVQGDALQVDLPALFPGDYKVVANLPYHITSPLLLRLLGAPRRPRLVVVTVQREVAERITAGPGALSYLAIAVQLYAVPRIVRLVPPAAFYPRPKVESAVLRLDVRPAPAVAATAPAAFLRLVQAGFKQPRKQLRNSLAEGLGRPPAEIEPLLQRAGLDPTRRPQTLTLEEWERLYDALAQAEAGGASPASPCKEGETNG